MQRGGRYPGRRGGWRGRGRGRGGGGGLTQLKGLFADNIWHCDCTPRLPAEHFKVKKEGKNQGRWFYTCQNRSKGPGGEPKGGCDFFLWDEDAKLREEATVIGNGAREKKDENENTGRVQVQGKGLFATNNRRNGQVYVHEDSETDTSSPTPTPATNGSKKRARQDDEDDFSLGPDDEQDLANLADSSPSFQTPHKAQKIGAYATPATTVRKTNRKLPWVEESSIKKTTNLDFFATPSKPPTSSSDQTLFADSNNYHTPRPTTPTLPSSPSPSTRHKNALDNPADSSSSLTAEVLSLNLPLPRDQLESLRSILSKHDLKTQGVTRGRDISRLALKAKSAKIVELEAKIASLEADREVDRSVIARLRWSGENGVKIKEEEDEDEGESQL